jgi:SAM-dependent methyltransferase
MKEILYDRKELIIGCGRKLTKQIQHACLPAEFKNLTTLDIEPDHDPDILWDLNKRPLPFEDDTFDEIHAYEVLEHIGRQGDYIAFFEEFSEYWRILKPGGLLVGTCPSYKSGWAWGDPSHVRVLTQGTISFLSQEQYASQVGTTSMTDYRSVYSADFKARALQEDDVMLAFILEALK